MKLTVLERLRLLQVLPKEGSIITLRVVDELRKNVAFKDEEIKKFNVKEGEDQEGNKKEGIVSWNEEGYKDAEVELGEKAVEIVVDALEDINKNEKLTNDFISLWGKIRRKQGRKIVMEDNNKEYYIFNPLRVDMPGGAKDGGFYQVDDEKIQIPAMHTTRDPVSEKMVRFIKGKFPLTVKVYGARTGWTKKELDGDVSPFGKFTREEAKDPLAFDVTKEDLVAAKEAILVEDSEEISPPEEEEIEPDEPKEYTRGKNAYVNFMQEKKMRPQEAGKAWSKLSKREKETYKK